MSIEKTAALLSELLEAYWEARATEMTEVVMLAIPDDTVWAIENAKTTLEGLRILTGVYTEAKP